MNVNDEFRLRLKVEMEAKGLNPTTLSAKAGLNHMAVRDLLAERSRSPKLSTAHALAIALGVTLDELVGDKPQASVSAGFARFISQYSHEEQDQIMEAILRLPRSRQEAP